MRIERLRLKLGRDNTQHRIDKTELGTGPAKEGAERDPDVVDGLRGKQLLVPDNPVGFELAAKHDAQTAQVDGLDQSPLRYPRKAGHLVEPDPVTYHKREDDDLASLLYQDPNE